MLIVTLPYLTLNLSTSQSLMEVIQVIRFGSLSTTISKIYPVLYAQRQFLHTPLIFRLKFGRFFRRDECLGYIQ